MASALTRPSSSRGSDVMLVPDHEPQHLYSTNSVDKAFIYENRIEDDSPDVHPRQRLANTHTMWPSVIACVPMMLLCAALLALIFSYEVKPMASAFSPSLTPREYYRSDYLLVHFSDTKIVFLASFLSTLAPMLAGCLMSLASISLVHRHCTLPRINRRPSTLVSDQQELLSGVISASYGQLISSCKYFIRRKGAKMPSILFYATMLLLLTVFMSIAVAVADAALHVFTTTINFTLYSASTAPTYEHGRGINALCLDFDRVKQNYGFPCTNEMDPNFVDPDAYEEAAESQKLAHNTSTIQEIRFFNASGTNRIDMVYLTPEASTVDQNLDYKATTIGVSSQCSVVPANTCNLTRWGPYDETYTNFNCSHNFWGTLGLAQNATPINSYREPSPYLPLLSVKPQSNLQYGFYNDPEFYSIYNPASLNDSSLPDPSLQPIPDVGLPTSLYWAFAWRSSWGSFVGGEDNEMISSNLTGVYPGIYYLDFFLSCEITALDVEYNWINGTVDPTSITGTKMSNGTALNMWQGTITYGPSINGGGHILQDIHTQASVAGTTIAAYESRFGALLGQQVLAKIGGYTSPRTVQQQQMRQTLLLSKIPKASLGALVGCSLLYPVLGLVLLYKARRSLREKYTEQQHRPPPPPPPSTTRQVYMGHPLHDTKTMAMLRPSHTLDDNDGSGIGRAIPMTQSPRSTLPKTPQCHQPSEHDFTWTLDPGAVYDLTPTNSVSKPSTPTTSTKDQRMKKTRPRDRNSTAAFRSVLWGSAGAGPNFDHLRTNEIGSDF